MSFSLACLWNFFMKTWRTWVTCAHGVYLLLVHPSPWFVCLRMKELFWSVSIVKLLIAIRLVVLIDVGALLPWVTQKHRFTEDCDPFPSQALLYSVRKRGFSKDGFEWVEVVYASFYLLPGLSRGERFCLVSGLGTAVEQWGNKFHAGIRQLLQSMYFPINFSV